MLQEKKATLLINVRKTNEQFTLYSFPSKTIEYMTSGTPVLSSNLPGIPKEYHKYMFILEDTSKEGLKNKLQEILKLSPDILEIKGKEAYEFVIKNKNNNVQAQRILELLNKI